MLSVALVIAYAVWIRGTWRFTNRSFLSFAFPFSLFPFEAAS
jgi:hypothetical protein